MKSISWFLMWFVYFPLIRILSILLFWNRRISDRMVFEKKNKFEWLAHSFKEVNEKADICFEFSSEGEYQQVAPLIDDSLQQGKKLELVFFSPSVEKAILKLAATYPAQIRYLRYPFLRIFPFIRRRSFSHWVTAKTLVLVRYDLFPEFLLWSLQKENILKLIWISFKKERFLNQRPSWWKCQFLKNAKSIIYAGLPDYKQGSDLGFSGKVFDFRLEQIQRRVERKDDKFKSLLPIYPDLKLFFDKADKKIIVGNAWPSDLFLLRDLPEEILLVIVPHQLTEDVLNHFRQGLKVIGRDVFEINDQTHNLKSEKTILINKKGILCELYADFNLAYVGGGFEGSIHSVLEPLVAGTQAIACGPAHHRSTEYDVAKSAGRISEINTPEQFVLWINNLEKKWERDRMEIQNYEQMRELVISC